MPDLICGKAAVGGNNNSTRDSEDGKLIIKLDAEKTEIAKAEAEFMEKEMKKLQKKFQKEKEMIHAQFVAERLHSMLQKERYSSYG